MIRAAEATIPQGGMRRPRLLVVSSYRRPCGIAQYVEFLEAPLRQRAPFEVEIAALPVDLLRSPSSYARKAARTALRDILRRAADSDVVNIQLEPGIYGLEPVSVWRRLKAIIAASRKVLITYHTVPGLGREPWGLSVEKTMNVIRAWRARFLFGRLFATVRASPDRFHHIVQTARDEALLKLLGIPARTITQRPLAYLDGAMRETLRQGRETSRADLTRRHGIGADGVVLGCFGFLSRYKGIEVAIRAIGRLPEHHHLLIVGGLHPEGIAHHRTEQPYVRFLTSEVERSAPGVGARVHFVGAVDNEEFNRLMMACDAVVLPYAEVGQTSSGPAALALDMQQPLYCSHNQCFRELDAHQPGMVSFFEIGNHLELAQKLACNDGGEPRRVEARAAYSRRFDVTVRADAYIAAFAALRRAG